jgi:hypothetical protein
MNELKWKKMNYGNDASLAWLGDVLDSGRLGMVIGLCVMELGVRNVDLRALPASWIIMEMGELAVVEMNEEALDMRGVVSVDPNSPRVSLKVSILPKKSPAAMLSQIKHKLSHPNNTIVKKSALHDRRRQERGGETGMKRVGYLTI